MEPDPESEEEMEPDPESEKEMEPEENESTVKSKNESPVECNSENIPICENKTSSGSICSNHSVNSLDEKVCLNKEEFDKSIDVMLYVNSDIHISELSSPELSKFKKLKINSIETYWKAKVGTIKMLKKELFSTFEKVKKYLINSSIDIDDNELNMLFSDLEETNIIKKNDAYYCYIIDEDTSPQKHQLNDIHDDKYDVSINLSTSSGSVDTENSIKSKNNNFDIDDIVKSIISDSSDDVKSENSNNTHETPNKKKHSKLKKVNKKKKPIVVQKNKHDYSNMEDLDKKISNKKQQNKSVRVEKWNSM